MYYLRSAFNECISHIEYNPSISTYVWNFKELVAEHGPLQAPLKATGSVPMVNSAMDAMIRVSLLDVGRIILHFLF